MPEIVGYQLPEVLAWLSATLTGDATLAALVTGGWHEDPAPEATAAAGETYGTVRLQAPVSDLDAVGSHRIWEDGLYLVQVIKEGRSTAALKPAADRVDVLLHRTSGTTAGGRVLSSVREGLFYSPEVTNGRHYRRLGGFYRILAQPLVV